ncbi:MAG: hypothetical protein RIQ72_217 [Candidatus Parcubacteria bacterium]
MFKLPVNKYLKILAIVCALGLLYIVYITVSTLLVPIGDPIPQPQLPQQH